MQPKDLEHYQRGETWIKPETMAEVGGALTRMPDAFDIHKTVARQLDAKKEMFAKGQGFDWATAEALAAALIETGSLDHAKILVVTGSLNRDDLVDKLTEGRAIVDTLQVYKTEQTDLSGDPVAADFRARGADAILFASSSAVQSFADQAAALKLGKNAVHPIAGSIGPQTTETMKKVGVPVGFTAKTPNLDSLVEVLVKKLAS